MKRYEPEIDLTDEGAVKGLQDRLLCETVSHALARSPFYARRLAGSGIGPADIRGVDDIGSLPVTTKDDLQKDPWGVLCVERAAISEVVSTTGTTGESVYCHLTRGDIERLAENEARAFRRIGVGPGELVQVAVTMDNLFIAGLAYYAGLKRLGAGAVRSGPRSPAAQLGLLRGLEASTIVAVPSFMLHMAREAKRQGLDLRDNGLKRALLIGESILGADLGPNRLGSRVEELWGVECFSTYGITEAQAAFTECAEHRGLHAHSDMVYAEVLDDDGQVLPEGTVGELIVTTFKVEGMPLLRYRTGDVTFMLGGECPCGEKGQRIGPIIGRKAHRLKVKGTTVYPGAVKNAVVNIDGVVNYQITAFTGPGGTDMLRLTIGSEKTGPGFMEEVRAAVRSSARVTPELEVLKPSEVERRLLEGGGRKRRTFVDLRAEPPDDKALAN